MSLPFRTSSGVVTEAVNSRETLNRKSPPYMFSRKAAQALASTSGRCGCSSAAQPSYIW